jgi:hypothetical protein
MSAAASTRWISCPKCSRRARAGQPFCELCGTALASQDPAASDEQKLPLRSLRCKECGAAVRVAEGERTAACAFCATPYVAQAETSPERKRPEFVLPFGVSKKEAEASFKAWLGKSGWLTPGDLALQGRLSELRGVYVPFWSFSMRSQSEWCAQIGEDWYETIVESYTEVEDGKHVTRTRTRQVLRTEWYPLEGSYHQYHSSYLVAASKGLSQASADAIAPFPVAEVTRYAPHFLSGWLCEDYALEKEEAARISEEHFRKQEAQSIAAFLPGDRHTDLQVQTDFQDASEDLILLPVWILAYRYRNRTFRFLLNGVSGKTDGQKPWSSWRIAFLILAILLAAVVIFLAVTFLGAM